ncbi:hypothetical protein SAMN04487913_109230 [Arthrobacter sp. ok362]|nr:hypothetical protein SAMN04487913_109230 [Arthrobacter sp. ok362]
MDSAGGASSGWTGGTAGALAIVLWKAENSGKITSLCNFLPPKGWWPTPWTGISLSTKFIEGKPRADVGFLAAAVADRESGGRSTDWAQPAGATAP